MFQYMAAGKPIVCNVDIMYSAIVKHQIGVCHDMENDEAYADALRMIIDLPEADYSAMCMRAREAVKEYDYPYLTRQMADVIERL